MGFFLNLEKPLEHHKVLKGYRKTNATYNKKKFQLCNYRSNVAA